MAFTHSEAETNESSGDNRIDGILGGAHWANRKIFYSAPNRPNDYENNYDLDRDGDGTSAQDQDFSDLTARQLDAVKAALDTSADAPGSAGFSLEGFTKLKLKFAGSGSGEAEVRVANTSDVIAGYAGGPAGNQYGGDVWLGELGNRPIAGNRDYYITLHELGHAFGLKHGHEDSGFGDLPGRYDSPEYSVMTFRGYVGGNPSVTGNAEEWGNAQSYMMLDIAALQSMYGANYKINSDDTVYSWDPDSGNTVVNDEIAIQPGDNRIFATVWDGGGEDTYDLSAYRTDVQVDLRPGEHSVFSEGQLADLGGGPNEEHARGNIFNALLHEDDERSLIENATGGRGDDLIEGNDAANMLDGGNGDDTLRGGAGDDTLLGGKGEDELQGAGGDDVFRFASHSETKVSDPDKIVAGGGRAIQGVGNDGGDLIDLSQIDADGTRNGNQAFEFADSKEAGAIWLRDRKGDTWVQGDRDGDNSPDFLIRIEDGSLAADDYVADDFIL